MTVRSAPRECRWLAGLVLTLTAASCSGDDSSGFSASAVPGEIPASPQVVLPTACTSAPLAATSLEAPPLGSWTFGTGWEERVVQVDDLTIRQKPLVRHFIDDDPDVYRIQVEALSASGTSLWWAAPEWSERTGAYLYAADSANVIVGAFDHASRNVDCVLVVGIDPHTGVIRWSVCVPVTEPNATAGSLQVTVVDGVVFASQRHRMSTTGPVLPDDLSTVLAWDENSGASR